MAAAGFVVVCEFTYRGNAEEWSQKYHLDSTPADAADWDATRAAFVTAFKATLLASVTIKRFYGYADTDDNAIYTYDYTTHGGAVAGTLGATGDTLPGDTATTVRWKTTRLNTKGKPIYLRKYWHGLTTTSTTAGGEDSVPGAFQTAYTTFAAAAYGTGWNGHKLADKTGTLPTGYFVSPWFTTRTLKRRGKRRPT